MLHHDLHCLEKKVKTRVPSANPANNATTAINCTSYCPSLTN